MMDFGSTGMPKVVVVGCDQAFVYYNKNDFISGQDIDRAIKDALGNLENSCENVSINEPTINSELKVYPNPSNDIINVEIRKGSIKEWTIYNSLGQIVEIFNSKGTDYGKNLIIDVASLEKGIYYVTVSNTDQMISVPFQKI
jgi:hypothetical protein